MQPFPFLRTYAVPSEQDANFLADELFKKQQVRTNFQPPERSAEFRIVVTK
jgi:hypothetical protein